jgi:GMP synthase (glutamine-hydrolysing)
VAALLNSLGVKVHVIDARERFLRRLEGVSDCEEKRRIVGETFAEVFAEAVARFPNARYLAQGTLYPDVIESGAVKGADKIKSHHNVGGLPPWFSLSLVEPLREFYKDEVRKIAKALGLPDEVVYRHPFPGPGLAVRIIGPLTREKLEIVRKATKIVEEELKKVGLLRKVWQAFAVVGDDKWVGVKGDRRAVGYIVTVRVVESEDAMTADWSKLPYDVLEKISARITSEIPQVTMVTYATTTKPPSTIEPC